jgi:hypothetical protein
VFLDSQRETSSLTPGTYGALAGCYHGHERNEVMKQIAIALATVATIAAMSAPAEARGGRNAAAIGLGIAGAVVAGAAAANSYNYYGGPAYYGEPAYGYGGPVYAEPVYGPGYYRQRAYQRNHSNDPNPVDMNPYNPW